MPLDFKMNVTAKFHLPLGSKPHGTILISTSSCRRTTGSEIHFVHAINEVGDGVDRLPRLVRHTSDTAMGSSAHFAGDMKAVIILTRPHGFYDLIWRTASFDSNNFIASVNLTAFITKAKNS